METTSVSMNSAARPGKSAQAVGQLAKAAVAEAKAAGAEVPRNALGLAASAIARGAEPASVFAATVQTDPGPADDVAVPPSDDGAEAGGMFVEGDDILPSDPTSALAENGYSDALSTVGDAALTSAEASLRILEDAA